MRNPLKRKNVPQDTKKVRKVFHGFVYATMEIDSPIQGMFTKNCYRSDSNLLSLEYKKFVLCKVRTRTFCKLRTAGEYEINIIDETENETSKQTVKRMKWETISGGNEIGILETALPNFAQGEF